MSIQKKIWKRFHNLGSTLNKPSEFAPFQTPYVVYHDDIGDYSVSQRWMAIAGAVE